MGSASEKTTGANEAAREIANTGRQVPLIVLFLRCAC